MTADAEIVVIPPAYSLNGVRGGEILSRLLSWADLDGRGITCDSSAGFTLPSGARRSPDASWTLKSRIAQLDPANREKFWRLCPDFVIELRSSTDRSRLLREKMLEYLANGAQLGWLIDPEQRSVAIYRPDGQIETLTGIDSICGEGPVAGFVLDLSFVWNPLGDYCPPA